VGVAVEQDSDERTVVERRDPRVGQVFDGRFQVEARIAAGGFGTIYRAIHLKSRHEFALKILHPNLTSDPDVVTRFRREGATLTRLRDPHTIKAYEVGEAEDGALYIVLELLYGESLYERYRAKGAIPWQRVIAIARAVCSSLEEAHALGIIHRDLKPTNIHLEQRGASDDFVKVLDFGIAKALHPGEIDNSELTNAGQMVGTLDYMPPEQMIGGTCTAASDIYTLGIVMYEMIAGRKPFDDANSAAAALAAMLTAPPPRLSTCAMVTPQVDHVVMRCLEHQLDDRYQSARELAVALDELLAGSDELITVATMTTLTGTEAPRARRATPAPKLITPAPQLITPAPKQVTPAPKLNTPVPSPFVTTLPLPVRRDLDPAIVKAGRPTQRVVPLPDPVPPIAMDESTIVGHRPAARAASATPPGGIPHLAPFVPPRRTTPAGGIPHTGTPAVPVTNLREVYPTIHRAPPSPMRSPFDDRPPSSANVLPFDGAAHRDVMIRRVIIALACAIAVLATILLVVRR